MELLDLWCGCLSWRTLAQHVRWLPRTAALYQSMRLARPVKAQGQGAPLIVTDELELLRYGTPDHIAELLLALLNRQEGRDWAESDKDKRGEFAPTLPPGYALSDEEADDEALADYLSAMQPPTEGD